jgi:hypothetical protein
MAWERMFEKRILKIRDRELSYQWRSYVIEARRGILFKGRLLIPHFNGI